jgi:hypothetical protein
MEISTAISAGTGVVSLKQRSKWLTLGRTLGVVTWRGHARLPLAHTQHGN